MDLSWRDLCDEDEDFVVYKKGDLLKYLLPKAGITGLPCPI
jgi:hypothetical protein